MAAPGQTAGNILDNGEHSISIKFGIITELVLSIGYAYGLALSNNQNYFNHAQIHTNFKMIMGKSDLKDISLELGFKPTLAASDQWSTNLLISTAFKTTENNLYNGFAISSDIGLISGYFDSRESSDVQWFAANELIYTYTWATYLNTKDIYKEFYFKKTQDGWYISPASLLRIGVQIGLGTDDFSIALRSGYELFNEFSIFTTPFYALLSSSYQFR